MVRIRQRNVTIYVTDQELKRLKDLTLATRKNQSVLMRELINREYQRIFGQKKKKNS